MIIIGIVLLGALAGVTLYYVLPEFRASPGAPPGESASAIEGILSVLSTRVFVQTPAQAEPQEIEDSSAVGTGSLIKTSPDGRGLLELPDRAAVTIDQNSEFTFEASEHKTQLSVATGNVWTRAKKLFDQDELYEVRSPNTVATVRGTSFSFGYAGRVSTVLVVDGRVSVTALDPASGAVIPETTVLVQTGEKAIVDDRKLISERVQISRLDAADLNSEWYRLNNPPSDDGSPPPAAEIIPKTPPPPPSFVPSIVEPTPAKEITPTPVPAPAPEPPPPPPPPPPQPRELRIDRVIPDAFIISPTGLTAIQALGSGFLGASGVNVGAFAVKFEVADDVTLWLHLSPQIPPGTYDVAVSRGSEAARRSQALTVTAPPPLDTN